MTLIDLTAPSVRSRRLDDLPVAIIGAGPIGLAAAANLVERGLDFVLYEAGDSIASSMRSWGHIRLFSPWKHLIDPAARRLLEADGWVAAALPGQRAVRRRARRAVPRAAGCARPDRVAHPHGRDRRRGDPAGHGPHPFDRARRHSLRAEDHGCRRVRLRGDRERRHRRVRHLPHRQQPRLERTRPARHRRGRRPRHPRPARRARSRAQAVRGQAHHRRRRRPLGGQHADQPRHAHPDRARTRP